MPTKNLIMDPNRLKKARPDLWPVFLKILEEEAPAFHEMMTNNSPMKILREKLRGKWMLKVHELPERARKLIHQATEEAKQRASPNDKN